MCSVPQGEEGGHATANPVVLVLIRWQVDIHDEVGRVTGRGQSSSATQHLVDRAHIDSVVETVDTQFDWGLWLALGLEPDKRQLDVELLGLRFIQFMDGLVPSCSLEEHAETEDSILRLLLQFGRLDLVVYFEVKVQLVDSKHVLSSVVLRSAGEESLREEESR